MTLGPMLVLLGLVEGARGPIAGALETFGRVPFFYYLLHIPTIHLAAVVVSLIREGSANPWLFTNHPMMNPPPPTGYTWSLPLLYLVWAIVIGVLYVACRWYAGVKAGTSRCCSRISESDAEGKVRRRRAGLFDAHDRSANV